MTTEGPEFGLCLPQFTTDGASTVRAAQSAQDDGYDAVSLFDHLRPLGGSPDRPILECLTMLTAVAAGTSRIRLLPLVLRAPMRPPATVCAVFRTLEQLAPGRLVCAVGGGDKLNEAEDLSVGLPALTGEQRRAAIRELVGVLRASMPEVPVWIGGTGPAMKALAGEIADGWNVWGATPEQVRMGSAEVLSAAGQHGRPGPRITWGGQVVLADTTAQAEEGVHSWGAGRSAAELAGVVRGDAGAVASQLRELVHAGAQTLMLSFVGPGAASARRTFARDVLPVVRRPGPAI
ncbi:MAG: LLM class flavin-dependent oxidoreductase [Actinomycetota bacterium]